MEASLRGGVARASKSAPLSTHRRRRQKQQQQQQRHCAVRSPRSGSLVPRALGGDSGDKDKEHREPWLGAAKTLASRATALALAGMIAASSSLAAAASSTATSTTTTTLTQQQQQQQLEEKKKPTKTFSSLVISGQIDYDRVARARSAVEKRKKREKMEMMGATESAASSSATTPAPTPATSTTTKATKRAGGSASSSELPSPDEADALLQFDRDAYTDDAWEAMKT